MPYRSAHAGRLADLLMQQGELAASKAQNRGNLLSSLVQGVAGIPAGMQQRKAAEAEAINRQRQLDSRLATDEVQRRNAQDQIDQRGNERMDAAAAKDLALTTQKVSAWLGDIAGAGDPEAQKQAYATGRQALIAEGRLTPEDAPEFFPGASWVKSRMAMLLPAAERFKQMFPEPENPTVLGRGAQMRGPDGALIADNPMTPEPPAVGSFEDFVTTKYGARPTPEQIAEGRKLYQQADDRPPMGATVLIQTVDAQGNPITKIVTKTAGAEFAAPQTGAQRQQTAENTAVMTGLARLKELTTEPGSLDAWVGPVQGRVNSMKLTTPGIDVDPTMAEFFAETAAIKNRMIRAITGAQMSEPEAKRIMAQLPDINQKPEVFKARMAATERNLAALNAAMAAKGAAPTQAVEFDFNPATGQLVPRGGAK